MLRWPRHVSAASVGQLLTTSLHDIGHALFREFHEKVVRHVMHLPQHTSGWVLKQLFGSLSTEGETNPKRNQPFCCLPWIMIKNGLYPLQTRKAKSEKCGLVHLPWLLETKSTSTFKGGITNPNNALRTPESYPTFALFSPPIWCLNFDDFDTEEVLNWNEAL